MEDSKIYELVLFKNISVQLFWSSLGSFFLVFPSSRRFSGFIYLFIYLFKSLFTVGIEK